ncbi:NnrS family protein [Lysobacter sp. 2RAF19]
MHLVKAPHRLMFFIGAGNVLLAMAWWSAWLVSTRWPDVLHLAQPAQYAGWLHATVMQYQVLASFVFGFLLTVFPRWMGLPELPRVRYVPVGIGLFGGQIATLLGALGWAPGIAVGTALTLAGWSWGVGVLAWLVVSERGTTWHARACLSALMLGCIGVYGWAWFVAGGSPSWAFASIKLGTFGFLLPMYLTVAHRMFPFFASNVVKGYVPWRPMGLLAATLALCVVHLALELVHGYAWLWIADVPLFVLALVMLVRWWPRGAKPGLLTVLFVGLAWLPVTFALYVAQSLAYLGTGNYLLGRAPAHALFVGFFGSVLVAMVTRVTQGHSGRPLVMPPAAWFAFVAVQGVALVRVGAELAADPLRWQAIAAIGWLVALSPWVVRLGHIHLAPRIDGKPG